MTPRTPGDVPYLQSLAEKTSEIIGKNAKKDQEAMDDKQPKVIKRKKAVVELLGDNSTDNDVGDEDDNMKMPARPSPPQEPPLGHSFQEDQEDQGIVTRQKAAPQKTKTVNEHQDGSDLGATTQPQHAHGETMASDDDNSSDDNNYPNNDDCNNLNPNLLEV